MSGEKAKTIALRVAEFLLFVFAFAMLVPSVPSADAIPRLTPTLIIGGGSFALSLALSVRRHAEHWSLAILKLLFYMALAWIIYERVFGLG